MCAASWSASADVKRLLAQYDLAVMFQRETFLPDEHISAMFSVEKMCASESTVYQFASILNRYRLTLV